MPISDCQVRDPRMRRTRKLLQGALASLMQEKSFDEISVQDITEAATVNRATFYDHYTDKYALLEALVAGGFHELMEERHLRYDTGCPAALGAIIRATCDYLVQVHSTGSCDRQTAFAPLMDAAVTVAIDRLLVEGLRRTEFPSPVSPELIAATVSAAIAAGVKQWLLSPARAEVKEFVVQLSGLLLPVLDAAVKEGSPVGPQVHREASSPGPA
jgi:AcrR family transcriptional regulator